MKKVLACLFYFLPLLLAAQPCKEVIGYYPNWQWYDRAKLVNPMTIDYSKYTIINYAFFKPNPDGTIVSTDTWADDNLLLGPTNWQTNPPTHNSNQSIIGKAHAAGVKVLVSVGGWTLSDDFPAIAANSVKRATFAGACKSLVQTYDLDGIDIDWEYPGYTPHNGTIADKQNFTIFLQQIRDSLTAYQAVTGKTYLLTAAVGASQANMANVEWNNVKNILDIINVMSYDFFGAWDPITNHNSPLYAPAQGDPTFNINSAISYLMSNYNVPANKIAAGVAFYGRSAKTTSTPNLHVASTGTVDNITFQQDDGSPLYYNILANMPLFTPHWDNTAQVPYLTGNGNLNTFVSYDNQQSIGLKAQYIKNNNLRGAIIWEITGDYIETSVGSGVIAGTPLADTLNQVFCGAVNGGGGNVCNTPTNIITTPTATTATITWAATGANGYNVQYKLSSSNTWNVLSSATNSLTINNLTCSTNYQVQVQSLCGNLSSAYSTAITFSTSACPVNIPPTVALTSPANNAVFPSASTVVLQAAASDIDGTVSKVQFYRGATLIGQDLTAPYSLNWTNVAVGTYSITAKATDNSNAVTTSQAISVQVVANTPPTISLTSPINNTTFPAPATLNLQANATDVGGVITKVQFYNGATLLGQDLTAPYSFSWANVPIGTYTITAKATDNSNAVTTSQAISVQVVANIPPTVSLTSPVNNANFASLANINFTANASDADGTISKVQFYRGNTLLGQDLTAPYSFSWTNVPAGSYTITAKATDNTNAVTTSAAITFTVTMPANNILPTVSLVSPTNNATFSPAPANIVISATANDANGTIHKVLFYNGNTLLNQDFTAPYTYTWSNVVGGSYTIKVRSMDNNGAISGVAQANITVSGGLTGSTCASPQYVAGISYAQNDIVQNLSNEYTCNVPGWCSGSSQFYAPGTGTNWQQAWSVLGACAQVVNGNALPFVNLTAPAQNAAYIAPASFALSATASDLDGTISKVEFWNGNTLLGQDLTAPYSLNVSNMSAGIYYLTAKAFDNWNANTVSAPITVVIGSNTTPCTRPAWLSTSAYVANDTISYAGVVYRAKWWTQNENPATTGANGAWQNIGNCGSAPNIRLANLPTLIFPNPVTNILHIQIGEINEPEIEITLFNLLGEKVYSKTKLSNNHIITDEIDMEKYAKGVYTLVLSSTSMRWVEKVIKE